MPPPCSAAFADFVRCRRIPHPLKFNYAALATARISAEFVCGWSREDIDMRQILIGSAALLVATLAGVGSGSAQHWVGRGTWCIQPPIGGGSWTCYYYSLRQCRATLMYGNGSCVPNPTADWERRGFKIPPEYQPDYAKGRRTERDGR